MSLYKLACDLKSNLSVYRETIAFN